MRLERLACIDQPIDAVLPDGLQGAVASPARICDRDQEALVGKPSQDGRDGTAGHRRPIGEHDCRRGGSEGGRKRRNPAQDRLVGPVQQRVAPVERRPK